MREVNLDEVAKFINGYAFKPTDWTTEGLKIIRIQNLTNPNKNYNRTTTKVHSKYLVKKGDILVSWSATLDVFEWNDEEDGLLNQHIFKVLHDETIIDKKYFMHVLKYSINLMSQFTHGSTMKHIVRKDFLNHKIPLPGLNEQKRIVQILDNAHTLRSKRNQTFKLVDKYINSYFLQLFGDPISNTKVWQRQLLGDVVEIKSGQVNPCEKPYASMIHIGGADIESNSGRIKRMVTASEAGQTSGKYLFDNDYLLYSKIRPNLNKVALPEFSGICSADIYPIKPKETLNKHFLAYILKSEGFLRFAINNSGRANIPKINRLDLMKFEIIVPPINLQNSFADKWKNADNLKMKMKLQEGEFENQYLALLQKVFKS